jgi:hypothetical protein
MLITDCAIEIPKEWYNCSKKIILIGMKPGTGEIVADLLCHSFGVFMLRLNDLTINISALRAFQ